MTIRDDLASIIEPPPKRRWPPATCRRSPLPEIVIERPARPEHGDYATNLPLRLGARRRANPLDLARHDRRAHQDRRDARVRRGRAARLHQLPPVRGMAGAAGRRDRRAPAQRSGTSTSGDGKRVQVEFVSANPTGPAARRQRPRRRDRRRPRAVLEAAGYDVAARVPRQRRRHADRGLRRTLFARYQQLFGASVEIPADGYPGEYMIEVAKRIRDEVGDTYADATVDAPPPEMVLRGVDIMVERIREDLARIGVQLRRLVPRALAVRGDSGSVYETAMQTLREQGRRRREGRRGLVRLQRAR